MRGGPRLGARPDGRRVPPGGRHTGPRAEPDRARHLLRDVVRALQLQELPPPSAQAPDQRRAGAAGARRERRRHRHRRRSRGGVQDRVAQPPVVHRAVSGRRHRGRRHHPRHLHHGGPPDRPARFATVRVARRSAHPPARGRRRRGHCRLREQHRHSDGRRRAGVRRELRGKSPRQRLLPRHGSDRCAHPRPGGGGGQPRLLRGRPDGARRHPRGHDGLGRVRRDARPRSGRTSRWATRSWRSCCSRPAWR